MKKECLTMADMPHLFFSNEFQEEPSRHRRVCSLPGLHHLLEKTEIFLRHGCECAGVVGQQVGKHAGSTSPTGPTRVSSPLLIRNSTEDDRIIILGRNQLVPGAGMKELQTSTYWGS